MNIRQYRHSDQNSIITLLKLNTPEYFAPEEEQALIHYLNHDAENYYVVEAEGNIAGCGGFNLSDNPEIIKIAWDIVHPQSQGKGFGSALTSFRIQKIKTLPGIKTVVVRTSQLAYPFYERFGFEIKDIVRDYWAEGFDLYYMDCDINDI